MTDLAQWWENLLTQAEDRSQAINDLYQHLENADLISKVAVSKYLCERGGCVLATVIRVEGVTIARTKHYSLSPGANAARSVEAARAKNTLDGDHVWPGHTFEVSELATWGEVAGIDMNCSHRLRVIKAVEIMAGALEKVPGRPGKPFRI